MESQLRSSRFISRTKRAWKREHRQRVFDRLVEVYQDALALAVNFGTAVNVPGTKIKKDLAKESVFVRMKLFAIDDARDQFDKCFEELKTTGDPKYVPDVIKAAKKHLDKVESEILSGD